MWRYPARSWCPTSSTPPPATTIGGSGRRCVPSASRALAMSAPGPSGVPDPAAAALARSGPGGGMDRKEHRRSRRLREVKVGGQVAEDGRVLPDIGPGVGSAVGFGVEALTPQEVVLDELGEGVER